MGVKKMNKKIVVSIFVVGLMLVSSGASINALSENKQSFDMTNSKSQNLNNGITNITVQEAWDLLTDTGNGIQVLIDVRRITEWRPERMDTPIPEHPRWYLLDLLQNASILPKFMAQYDGCDILVSCKSGGRSWKAAKIIYENNFTGTICNVIGGLNAWKAAGLPTAPGGIYNITVNEAMDLCSSTINGIQNPIDVRTIAEWNSGFIDTPWPECPIWYTLDLLKDEENRTKFMADYIGQELILYCKGGYRSLVGSYELFSDNFTGTQYNMLGGITDWQAEGLPIRNNTPPAAPTITCEDDETKLKINTSYNFTFSATDPEDDGICYFIDWGDGNTEWTEYSDEDVIVGHTYFEKRTNYNVTSYAKDFYGNESGWGYLNVKTPKSKIFNNNFYFLEWLFERFPNAFPVLRQLLRL